jgi:hypothetical protein
MKLKTAYSEYDVILSWGKYGNGRKALEIIDSEDGFPVMVATVNIPEVPLTENEVIIKNYSENEGVLEFLQENGIVGPVKREVGTGFVSFPVVDVYTSSDV